MTNWQAEARDAAADLAEEGFQVTLHKRTGTGGSFYAPTHANTAHSLTVVQDVRRVVSVGGAMTEKSVRTLYAAADGPSVEKGDVVMIDGTEYAITEVRAVAPGGVPVLYELDLAD